MIYLDNAATTRVDEDILKTYNEISLNNYANPASPHIFSKETESLLEKARKAILTTLRLSPFDYDVIFTSGATEANNLGIIGYALREEKIGKHIIVSKTEHPSVLESCRYLAENGFEVDYLNVTEKGSIDLKHLQSLLREDTILVCTMGVNNETGAINNLPEIKNIISPYKNAKLFSDGTQALGKVNLPYHVCDFITLSGHKIHGLKGQGILIKRKNLELIKQTHGGSQENGLRSGTSNVAGCYCLAKSLQKATISLQKHNILVKNAWNLLNDYIASKPDLYEINSYPEGSPYVYNFSLKNRKASVLVEALSMKGIMVSSVSACSSKKEPVSYVLEAMGRDKKLCQNSIRASFSKYTTSEEIIAFINALEEILPELKANE